MQRTPDQDLLDAMTPPAPYTERLTAIQSHLQAGGSIMLVCYGTCPIYGPKHCDWFSADSTGLYVKRGKGRLCLNFTGIKFSVMKGA